MKVPDKLCYYCVYFDLMSATPGYSSWTPGEGWSMDCAKGMWEYDTYDGGLPQFRKCIEAAMTCKHYKDRANAD